MAAKLVVHDAEMKGERPAESFQLQADFTLADVGSDGEVTNAVVWSARGDRAMKKSDVLCFR
jgi:hypothetical protein